MFAYLKYRNNNLGIFRGAFAYLRNTVIPVRTKGAGGMFAHLQAQPHLSPNSNGMFRDLTNADNVQAEKLHTNLLQNLHGGI